jgi:XTP/dITP diphosphohydrolase
VSKATGLPAIADDTALEVDALGGAPGLRSARFASESTSYDDNTAKLLRLLAGVGRDQRFARVRTVALAFFPDGSELVAEGTVEGTIAEAPRGGGGFGTTRCSSLSRATGARSQR